MSQQSRQFKILVVDDEWESPIVAAVVRRLEREGWRTIVVKPESKWSIGDEFEAAALFAVEEERPDGVLLDVRFGEEKEERFQGLAILSKIVDRHPGLPILMFTQYTQGPDRETVAAGSLRQDAPVDFIDKLASPEEVVLRFRRLIGTPADNISIGGRITIDSGAKLVYVDTAGETRIVDDIQGMKFEILRELAATWYKSPGELVPFARLERYSEGEDPRASLRVRIREIKDSLGSALGHRLGASELIINVRDQGYRLSPPSG
jgi:DNA-binding response OmpR family regulator